MWILLFTGVLFFLHPSRLPSTCLVHPSSSLTGSPIRSATFCKESNLGFPFSQPRIVPFPKPHSFSKTYTGIPSFLQNSTTLLYSTSSPPCLLDFFIKYIDKF
nr:MAG TPA: hypothetical protein [Caudoviricetes sp.]